MGLKSPIMFCLPSEVILWLYLRLFYSGPTAQENHNG